LVALLVSFLRIALKKNAIKRSEKLIVKKIVVCQQNLHIAVMRLSAMGDVAMTVPVLRALVQQHPEVELTVISRPFF
jgi:hypothetical protein